MNCSKCGAPLNNDTVFCSVCGEPVQRPAAAPGPAPGPGPVPGSVPGAAPYGGQLPKKSGVQALLAEPDKLLQYGRIAGAALMLINLIMFMLGSFKISVNMSSYGVQKVEKSISLFEAIKESGGGGYFWLVLAILLTLGGIALLVLPMINVLPAKKGYIYAEQIITSLFMLFFVIGVKSRANKELAEYGFLGSLVKIHLGFTFILVILISILLIALFAFMAYLSLQTYKNNNTITDIQRLVGQAGKAKPAPQGGYQPPQGGYQAPQQGGYQAPQGGYQPPQQGGYQPPQQSTYQPPQQSTYQPPQQTGYQAPQQTYQPPQDPQPPQF